MKIPVFDLHCDTSLMLAGRIDKDPCDLKKNKGHIDLERASALEAYCQCFACFTSPLVAKDPVTMFEREIAAVQREVDKNRKTIALAYTPEDIDANREAGVMSAILTIEGPAGFGYDPALLEDLHLAGFRLSTLGWNEQNPLTGSNVTGGGLTDLGREYVKEAQRLGMVVDVSHISDEGFYGIMDCTQAPIVASHSNSRFVCGHARNITDDMFRQICSVNGTVGINQYAAFLGEHPTLDTICDHIFHFMEMDPEGEHISLGGDLDGCEELAAGFEGLQSYPVLADRLLERGLGEKILRRICWDNAMRVLRSAGR